MHAYLANVRASFMKVPEREQLKELIQSTEIIPKVTCRAHCIHFYNGKWYNDYLDAGVMSVGGHPLFKVKPKRVNSKIIEGIGRTYFDWPTKGEVYSEIVDYYEERNSP